MLGELIDGKNNTVKKRGNSVPEEVPNTAVFVPKKKCNAIPLNKYKRLKNKSLIN
jgi:hypothetical protein